jgi:hypothetical protein
MEGAGAHARQDRGIETSDIPRAPKPLVARPTLVITLLLERLQPSSTSVLTLGAGCEAHEELGS